MAVASLRASPPASRTVTGVFRVVTGICLEGTGVRLAETFPSVAHRGFAQTLNTATLPVPHPPVTLPNAIAPAPRKPAGRPKTVGRPAGPPDHRSAGRQPDLH